MRARTRFLALESTDDAIATIVARLETWGCVCLTELSADELARQLVAGRGDVVLVDASRSRALEIAHGVKVSSGARHAAVVAVTDQHAGAVAAQALALGADDVFALPLTDAELVARIRGLSTLAALEFELARREQVLRHFLATLYGSEDGSLRQDAAGILLLGSACGEQVQLVNALSGRTTVTYAESVERALDQLRRQDFDAVVASSLQDEGEAARLCRELRADARLFDLPILVTLSAQSRIARDQPFAWGASDVFVHPLHPEILRLRAEGWVRQQRLRRCLRGSFDGRHPLPVSDQLTGLYGHGFAHGYLGSLLHGEDGPPPHLAVAAFNVRNMRRLNQQHGFAFGDRALAVAGALIARYVRAEDVPARLAGDSFVVILNGTDGEGALRAADRVAAVVAATPLVTPDGSSLRLRLDHGVAVASGHTDAAHLVADALADIGAAALREAS